MTRNKTLDAALRSSPDHIKQRLGQKSNLGQKIGSVGIYGFGWQKADELGRAIKSTHTEMMGANLERHLNREKQAAKLKALFPDIWGNRGAAKVIAIDSASMVGIRLTERTIQRYMKDFP